MRWLVIAAFALSGSAVFAQADCKGQTGSVQALLACAEKFSPDTQDANLDVERAKAQIRAAGQWQNPELSAESFTGTLGGDRRSETDLSLGVPIELGGKISARTSAAEADLLAAEAKLYAARSKVRSELNLKLHRLRQALHEEEIIDEAIGTFSKLVRQYGARPKLSPEQQLSASVFQMSKGDYDLKKAAGQDELLQLETYFRLNLGVSLADLKKVAPEVPKTWPELKAPSSKGISPTLRMLQAELQSANAEASIAQSQAWPTLTVGPSMKLLREEGQSSEMIGFNVSLPIPAFNLNGGARAAAGASVRLAEKRKQLGEIEQNAKREELVKVYQQSIQALSSTLSHKEIEKRHSDSERLFERGIVPASLVIEAHRSSFELERARHERELRALEALYGIYAIDGSILEVGI